MLGKNITALCFYQGVPNKLISPTNLLQNLWQLFHSPSLGHPVHASLKSASMRVSVKKQAKQDFSPRKGSGFVHVEKDKNDLVYVQPSPSKSTKTDQGWDLVGD